MKANGYTAIVLLTLSLLLVQGCDRDDTPFVQQEIPLIPFHKLELKADVEVLLYQNPWPAILAEGSVESLHALDFEFSNNRLTIRDTGPLRSDTRIHIHVPDLSLIENRGRGAIVGQNFFNFPGDVEFVVTQNGIIDLALYAPFMKVRHRGNEQVFLEGETRFLDLKVSDSGNFNGFGLTADEAGIVNTGSGDIEVTVEDFMDVRISGQGNVFYRGYPGYLFDGNGQGQLIHVD